MPDWSVTQSRAQALATDGMVAIVATSSRSSARLNIRANVIVGAAGGKSLPRSCEMALTVRQR